MHPRFEIRLLTDIIIGDCPSVTILRIAWEDKRDHLDAWMLQYFRVHGELPDGSHEPGRTPRHGLAMGVVDFDAARRKLERQLEIRARLTRLLPRLQRLFGAALAARSAQWIADLSTRMRLPTGARY